MKSGAAAAAARSGADRGISGVDSVSSALPRYPAARTSISLPPLDVVRSSPMAIQGVRLASVSYTSGDGATTVPSYLAEPEGKGPHPAVLILRGVAGPNDGYTEIARRLAEWGYVALVHGWKIRGTDPPDAP